jgi:hypothetical protein
MISASTPFSAEHRLGDVDHRAIGQHGQRRALAHDPRLAERESNNSLRALAAGSCLAQGSTGAVVIAVERAVVDALGLEEDHRIVVLDRGDQQALGVVRR